MFTRSMLIGMGCAVVTVLHASKGSPVRESPIWAPGEAGGGQVRFHNKPLLDVRSKSHASVPPWRIESGALTFPDRAQADVFAIRQSALPGNNIAYEADIQILEGDVAGIVLAAEKSGAPCYGVLLSAQSRSVRIVYLPWPGADLHIASAPIERNRLHKLTVRTIQTAAETIFEVSLDEKVVTSYRDRNHRPAGAHAGVMTNNSVARFERLAAFSDSTESGRSRIFEDRFEADSSALYLLEALQLPARWDRGALVFETRLPESGHGMGAVAEMSHHIANAKHIWIPHVSPYPDTVIGDHSFRSPAVVLADERRVMALVPNVDDLRAAQQNGWRVWMDYDHERRLIRLAAGDFGVGRFHVAFQPKPLKYSGQQVKIRVDVLASDRTEDLENPYGLASRFLWDRWGRAGYSRGGSQRAPFGTYSRHVVNWAFENEPKGWGDTVWQEFSIAGKQCGAPAFIVDVAQHPSIPTSKRRWREQRSVWNQAWFSNQRTANGLLRYARQVKSKDLERRARLMTRVALLAPQTDGLFPAVYTAGGGGYRLYSETPGWENGRWTNSDRRPPGVSEKAVHILDAAFTCRLMLEWHDLNEGETEALDYVLRFADRLYRLQRDDGSFPGWVEVDGSVPAALSSGPESAMSAVLLLDLTRRFPKDDRFRNCALKALSYLEHGPVKESRWEDFETYYSCSRWGSDKVGQIIPRNGVFKSNTFSPFWCAEAFVAGSRVFKSANYLALGRRCLDELSLYQQVWEPPSIPAPTHGGFGVMNADGEWNDARQSLFAPLYLEYYRDTGHSEYFERGVSALRASFAMMYCPENAQVKGAYEKQHPFFGRESYGFMMENIAHGGPGPDPIGPFTIFTWGNGAALEAAAKVRDAFGQVYVDTARRRAFGLDGFSASIENGVLKVRDHYERESVAVVTSRGERKTIPLRNGRAEKSVSATFGELESSNVEFVRGSL